MISIQQPDEIWSKFDTMAAALEGAETNLEKIDTAINMVKLMPINGCITGSVWLPGFDPDAWGTTPDVDVFVYSQNDLVKAVTYAEHKLRMTPGTGTARSEQQERWKLQRLYSAGLNYKLGITTYKFFCDGVVLNFTYKQVKSGGRWTALDNAPAVLMSFDMSFVMQAYDIKTHVMFDLRPDYVDERTAIPNPLREQDCMVWTISKWVRQFDRVVKYWNRGYDTRPMARFYIEMIDKCIEAGCLFDSDESKETFENFSSEFLEKRAAIAEWLEDKEDM